MNVEEADVEDTQDPLNVTMETMKGATRSSGTMSFLLGTDKVTYVEVDDGGDDTEREDQDDRDGDGDGSMCVITASVSQIHVREQEVTEPGAEKVLTSEMDLESVRKMDSVDETLREEYDVFNFQVLSAQQKTASVSMARCPSGPALSRRSSMDEEEEKDVVNQELFIPPRARTLRVNVGNGTRLHSSAESPPNSRSNVFSPGFSEADTDGVSRESHGHGDSNPRVVALSSLSGNDQFSTFFNLSRPDSRAVRRMSSSSTASSVYVRRSIEELEAEIEDLENVIDTLYQKRCLHLTEQVLSISHCDYEYSEDFTCTYSFYDVIRVM